MKTETKVKKIPVIRESGEVRILVETLEREEESTTYFHDDGTPMYVDLSINTYDPYQELQRIIHGGRYKLELVRGYLPTDKPLLIIREDNVWHSK